MRKVTITGEQVDDSIQSKSTLELARIESESFFDSGLKKRITQHNKAVDQAVGLYETANTGTDRAASAKSGQEALTVIQEAKAAKVDAVIAERDTLNRYLELDEELRSVFKTELGRLATEQREEHEKTLAAMESAGIRLGTGTGKRDIQSDKEKKLERRFKELRKRRSDQLSRGVVDRRLQELDGKLMEVIREL